MTTFLLYSHKDLNFKTHRSDAGNSTTMTTMHSSNIIVKYTNFIHSYCRCSHWTGSNCGFTCSSSDRCSSGDHDVIVYQKEKWEIS